MTQNVFFLSIDMLRYEMYVRNIPFDARCMESHLYTMNAIFSHEQGNPPLHTLKFDNILGEIRTINDLFAMLYNWANTRWLHPIIFPSFEEALKHLMHRTKRIAGQTEEMKQCWNSSIIVLDNVLKKFVLKHMVNSSNFSMIVQKFYKDK